MKNEKLTVEDVVKLVRLIDKVQKRGHYASIEFANYGNHVQVYFKRDGYETNKEFNFRKYFNLTNKDCDVDAYHETVLFFTNVIEESKAMTIEEIEEALGYKVCIVSEKEEEQDV